MADGVYAPEEKAAVESISNVFGIDYSYSEKAISLITDLFAVYSKIGELLSSK